MKTIQGALPLADWRLNPDEIHVWTISARSFRFDLHRNRFIAERGCMRTLLGCYLATEPAKVRFAQGSHVRPFLSGAFANSRLSFNMSHSEILGLLALAGDLRKALKRDSAQARTALLTFADS